MSLVVSHLWWLRCCRTAVHRGSDAPTGYNLSFPRLDAAPEAA
ncbi:MAG: hypothetical protein WAO02_17575 [Verrucomicrobiia bacterium]